jgi:hypothetical protein
MLTLMGIRKEMGRSVSSLCAGVQPRGRTLSGSLGIGSQPTFFESQARAYGMRAASFAA